MRIGVVVFPGSNCDHDTLFAFGDLMGETAYEIWHKSTDLENPDIIILPGGFSYGDYLRCGAIARFSPVMKEVINFAEKGGPVLGICNGFQVLCEAGLLPGVLRKNAGQKFLGKDCLIKVEQTDTVFTSKARQGQVMRTPVAHGDGFFYTDDETVKQLEDENRVVFRYCDLQGNVTPEANINGSVKSIAGICSENRRVVGMMPHPERAGDPELEGKTDGLAVLKSAVSWVMP